MRSWTEDFGKFHTNASDWDARKEIFIGYNDNTTGEEMVTKAIRLAKQYNCKIVGRVQFKPALVGGSVSFVVKCHSLTYRYFYDGGKTYRLHTSEVTEKDLRMYEQQFGTRSCVDDSYKKQFWFLDNWNNEQRSFSSLKKAKQAATEQIGVSCCIHETQPFGRGSKIVCFAPASGITPP